MRLFFSFSSLLAIFATSSLSLFANAGEMFPLPIVTTYYTAMSTGSITKGTKSLLGIKEKLLQEAQPLAADYLFTGQGLENPVLQSAMQTIADENPNSLMTSEDLANEVLRQAENSTVEK